MEEEQEPYNNSPTCQLCSARMFGCFIIFFCHISYPLIKICQESSPGMTSQSLDHTLRKIIQEFRGGDYPAEAAIESYNLERDIKAQVIELQRTEDAKDGIMEGISAEVPDRTFKGRRMFKGQFPNQKVSVEDLLQEGGRIWADRGGKDFVRYVHIPCNNMTVSSQST
jgi:hypothetical protein